MWIWFTKNVRLTHFRYSVSSVLLLVIVLNQKIFKCVMRYRVFKVSISPTVSLPNALIKLSFEDITMSLKVRKVHKIMHKSTKIKTNLTRVGEYQYKANWCIVHIIWHTCTEQKLFDVMSRKWEKEKRKYID